MKKQPVFNEFNFANQLIDSILEKSFSIMFERQAVYFYLMKRNGWTRDLLLKEIRNRAKQAGIDINSGVLTKESKVAEYALNKKPELFEKIDFAPEKYRESIHKIASVMIENALKYSALENELKKPNPKKIPLEAESGKASTEAESENESEKIVTYSDVIEYIKKLKNDENGKTTLSDILTLVQVKQAQFEKQDSTKSKKAKSA